MGSPAGGVCRPWTPQASTRPGPLGPNALRHAEQLIAAVAPLKLDPAAAWTVDPTVLPHLAHALRARAPDRDGTTFTTGLGTVLDGIARRFATPSRHLDGTATSATFIEFCKQLLHDIDGTIFSSSTTTAHTSPPPNYTTAPRRNSLDCRPHRKSSEASSEIRTRPISTFQQPGFQLVYWRSLQVLHAD
ncbi:hypothetical protein AB1484_04385 [Parafrankia sp. FMc6]|uniref:hypothetical protein n=1 Tax=Parafrankia soli TaxID=2599596 RepID=UPI0034D71940